MAWSRTATSLISFGFPISKFFQFMREEGQISHPDRTLGSREFALLMILIGLVALVPATPQHRWGMQTLQAQGVSVPYSLVMAVAMLVGGLGLLGLFMVIFRQECVQDEQKTVRESFAVKETRAVVSRLNRRY
jgi:putative membrane protein